MLGDLILHCRRNDPLTYHPNEVCLSKNNRSRFVFSMCLAGFVAGCVDRASTEPLVPPPNRSLSSQAGASGTRLDIKGNVTSTLLTVQADGSRFRRTYNTTIDQTTFTDGRPSVNANRNTFESTLERDSGAPIKEMKFGSPVPGKTINGRPYQGFAAKTRRLSVRRVDGKNIELHAVQAQGSATNNRAAGYLVVVDGVVRQQYEVTYSANGKNMTAVRSLSFNEKGSLQAEQVADVSQLSLASRVAAVDQAGLQRSVGRLLRGVANLVLPDQLHAQTPVPNCNLGDLQRQLEIASNVFLANAAAFMVASAACVLLPLSCGVAADLAIAGIALFVTVETLSSQVAACEQEWNGTGGGTGGTGGGGTGSTGGGGTGGTGGGGGDIWCDWDHYTYQDEQLIIHTVDNWVCHPV